MYIVPSSGIFVNMEILFTRTLSPNHRLFGLLQFKIPYLFTILEVLREVTLNMRLHKIVP